MLGGRRWIIWPASWYCHSRRLRSHWVSARSCRDHGHELAAVTDLGPMASRRPAVQHRPGRDQLLPVRVDWAEEVDLPVEGGNVGAALGRRLDSGRRSTSQQGDGAPKTVPLPAWRTPPGLSLPQAGGCPSTGRSGPAVARRGGWAGGFQAQTFPQAPGRGWKTRIRPHTASAAKVRTVSALRKGGRVDLTPAGAEMWTHELST
jgi:hypothetical protein